MIDLSTKIKRVKLNSNEKIGQVQSAGDGIVWISGLPDAMFGEVINLGSSYALVMNLEEDKIGAVVLGDYNEISAGDMAIGSGETFKVGVGKSILGRVINPLGNPMDEKGDYEIDEFMEVERVAPGIVDRQPVKTPLLTGILAIDAMIPIGRGQRQLIIGDRGTGKSTIAIDTIINQKDTGVISIYVAIGQKLSKIATVLEKLEETSALKNTVIVAASASSPSALRYLAPYVGTAIGEYFMQKGNDVLIVYDDLTKHAWAYRELSLLLRRPSGREAYPGDVFYLHSRLLERSCRLSDKNGGGSMTALPIIETQAGDVSAYIPTNVISITDGQIYLEPDLFFAGVRPAMNVGLSVSRVGGAAQTKEMKKVAGKLRLDLAQYYELATFAQFASETDVLTQQKIERGKRVVEILKQPQHKLIPLEEQIKTIFLVNSGIFDDIPINQINELREDILKEIKKIPVSDEEKILEVANKIKKVYGKQEAN